MLLLDSTFYLFCLLYLLYHTIAGIVLFVYYLWIEKKATNIREWVLLLLLPVIGLGNFRYNRTIRVNAVSEYPKGWFILKGLVAINKAFMLMIAFVYLILFMVGYVFNNGISIFLGKIIADKEDILLSSGTKELIAYIYGHWIAIHYYTSNYLIVLFIIIVLSIFLPIYVIKKIENKILKDKVQRNDSNH